MFTTLEREIIGANVRIHRKAQRLSQSTLGAAVGLDQSLVSRLELGKPIGLSKEQVRQIARILNCRTEALLPTPPATPTLTRRQRFARWLSRWVMVGGIVLAVPALASANCTPFIQGEKMCTMCCFAGVCQIVC